MDLDLEPALYLHEYADSGMVIRGIVGTLDLSTRAIDDSERAVYAHEGIHPAQADELAERMFEMGVNPAPILLTHHGSPAVRTVLDQIQTTLADHDYEDRSGQHHRLWRIIDAEQIAALTSGLASSRLMIADGHHRYAAYLRLQESHAGTAWDRGLAMVVDQDDTPFFLGAIHRTLPGVTFAAIQAALEVSGSSVRVTEQHEAIDSLGLGTWVVTDGSRWLTVTDDDSTAVQHLHQAVLPLLETEVHPAFHHTAEDALARAKASTVAVLLPAPGYRLLDHVMEQGTLLPEKATSFQPKPNIGVLMRSVDSDLLPSGH